MSQHQENPQGTDDENLQTFKETQCLEALQASKDVEETISSSHPLMPCNQKEDPVAQKLSTSEGLQGSSSSYFSSSSSPSSSSVYTEGLFPVTRSVMSQHQENPQGTHDENLQTFKEAQGLEASQASKDVEETIFSSHLLMPCNQKEDPEAQKLSTSEGLQSSPSSSSSSSSSFSSSSVYTEDTSSSSSTSSEASSSQEEESSPMYPSAGPNIENIPVDSLEQKVNFLVNYMLHKYQLKDIMTKEDILKIVIREDEDHFHEIFRRATHTMDIVFGLEVKEVDPANHCYGFFIKLGLTYHGMQNHEYSFPKTGLLIHVLVVIYMKGNHATEKEIWESLNQMGIYSGMNDFIFGDNREHIIKEFVMEQYLDYRQVPNTDPVQYEYVWGPRACAETSKMQVLEFVAKCYGTDIRAFPSQYEEAVLEERERTLQFSTGHTTSLLTTANTTGL